MIWACGMWMWVSMKPGIKRCGRWSMTSAAGAWGRILGGLADGGDAAVADQDGAVLGVGVGGGVVDAVGLAQEAQDAAAQDFLGHAFPLRARRRNVRQT